MIVKMPRIVPKGMNAHRMAATTKLNIRFFRRAKKRPEMNVQPAIDQPNRMNTLPMITKSRPKNAGGGGPFPPENA